MSQPPIRRRAGRSEPRGQGRTRPRLQAGLAIAVVALLGAAGATALASRPPEPLPHAARSSTTVPATQATLPCAQAENRHTATEVFGVAPAHGGSGSGAGELTVSTLDPDTPTVVDRTDSAGTVVTTKITPDDRPTVVVAATGALAPGLTGMQTSVEKGKTHSGLATSWCSSGAGSWWFSGVSTAVGSTSRIVLTNPTPAISVADLHFYGPKGPVTAVGARGIALAPETTQSINLSRFAPGLDALTVDVQATSGRVTAAIHTDELAGAEPLGSEWVTPSTAPAEAVLLNPGPSGADQQTLQITNPGLDQALVSVQLVSPDGTFTPTGYDSVSVKPGAVITKDITKIVGKDVTGVALTSRTPVTGAIVSTTSRPADFTVTSASTVLSDPAVVPLIDGTDLSLAFTSVAKGQGQVTIKAFTASGTAKSTRTVDLKGRTTTTWEPPKAARKAAYLVVTTDITAETQAVAVYDGKDGVTTVPVQSGTYTVSRPHVESSR